MSSRVLFVVRAGDRSLHQNWLAGSPSRSFDLHISYYGDKVNPYPSRPVGVTISREKGPKFRGLEQCLKKIEARISGYEYVGFPDDDLLADCATWNSFIETILAHRPAIAQPALSRKSFYTYDLLLQRPKYRIRWTNFVEVMCPFVQVEHLANIRRYFEINESGWGIEYLWRNHVEPENLQMCVVDAAPVLHTRAIGSGPLYKNVLAGGYVTPSDELCAVIKNHGISDLEPRMIAGVRRNGDMVTASIQPSRRLVLPRVRRRLRRHLSITTTG
jgi:hypothetical protein